MSNPGFNEGLPPRKHETVRLDELHHVGADRLPGFHHVDQCIQAVEPMDRFPYLIDTNEVRSVQPMGGCRTGELYRVTPSWHAVDIILETPLEPGQRARVEYTTWFKYVTPPPPESRRRIGARAMEYYNLTVRFEEEQLPENVWWAEWQSLAPDSPLVPGTQQEATLTLPPANLGLEDTLQVQRPDIPGQGPQALPGTIMGFAWQWPA